jgi:hypothetical protein
MKKKAKSKPTPPRGRPEIGTPSPETAAAIDKITSEDREWFEQNPGASSRTRPAAPGEFSPGMSSDCVVHVLVVQVQPGYRLRLPVVRMNLPALERVQ